jgi:inner membrane protein
MDVATQGLASLVVARAFVPRAGWRASGVIVAAGTIANVDFVSSMMSPSVYLEWHRTYSHSILFSLIVSVGLAAIYSSFFENEASVRGSRSAAAVLRPRKASAFFAVVILAGLLHLALDAAQSSGTMIFWPLSRQRVALDWLPRVDPWMIAILLAALLLPELTRLVSDEIGAKSKGPRGRIGAIIGLIILALYVGVRADLHSNAIAALQNRSYDSGRPHRVAAYADAGSPFIWNGIVETERALHQLAVSAFTSSQFDADNGVTLFKPEPSPLLAQAQQTEAARKFLAIAQFPKAEVEQTTDGHRVEIRDLRYAATGEPKEIRARVELDANGKVLNDELVWVREANRR